ncbi:MAG TPA: AbrB/MazE/SpoVT family DNA-binding domain-containing protein [Syntrophomonadaceae bacterium]|nr:AbrB/MazE/SpoVT family DNA-binding domain-containing protein [Syntrophomonadaceae bacterium]
MLYDVQINDRGQITIPKELRDAINLKAHDKLRLSIDTEGRIVVYKPNIFDDVEDLIRKDLMQEGLSVEQVEKKLPERKEELGKALLKMVSETDQEINRGDYITLNELDAALAGEE